MMRVTRMTMADGSETLHVEGRLTEQTVQELRDACRERGRRSGRLRLDLAAVTFADAAGTELLRDLVAEGVEIAVCSGFVGELLRTGDA